MEKLFVGKIVTTFGIKGELKVLSVFTMSEQVYQIGQTILINEEEHQITSVRKHQDHYLIGIDNYNDINLVLQYQGLSIYIYRENLQLMGEDYLLEDLNNYAVYDENQLVGYVSEVVPSEHNPLIKVDNRFYIPLRSAYIKEVNQQEQKITGERLKELIL